MKLFLDTSVLLAAAGSTTGASRAVIDMGQSQHWGLLTSRYCVEELTRNLVKLNAAAPAAWKTHLHPRLTIVRDTLVHNQPLLFAKTKDRPILITALAEQCDVLLTLDQHDFGAFLNRRVYELWIRTPAGFLEHERDQGQLTLNDLRL